MVLLNESLPDDPLFAEAVLHVRKHVRRRLRQRTATAQDLALLFAVGEKSTEFRLVQEAMHTDDPAGALTQSLGTARGVPVVSLGCDAGYREACRQWLAQRKKEEPAFNGIIAQDLATLLVLSKARDVAIASAPDAPGADRHHVPILIQGETGTGKELLARAIHEIWKTSTEAKGDFQVLHVAGMSSHLVDDELFGHVRGAFTGADRGRTGRLEAANHGTLLIDEVGDLSDESQKRLIRFLQDQHFSRLGETADQCVNVRILAATWHDLDARVEKGTFRRDLLFRLRVGSLVLPPLQARDAFFDGALDDLLVALGHTTRPALTRASRDALRATPWPGHLRHLVGALRQAMASSDGDTIRLEDLPAENHRIYLALPLHARAPGFLEEEHASQARSAELVAWRMRAIDESLRGEPPPALPPELAALLAFSTAIPDPSQEHATSVHDLQGHVALVQRWLAAHQAASVWSTIAGSGLSADVARLVDDRAATAVREANELHARVMEDRGQVAAANSPWVRLLSEITVLPLVQELPAGAVAQGLVGALKLLHLAAPEWARDLRVLVQKHGLEGLRAKLKQLLEEANAPEAGGPPGIPALPPGAYKTFDRATWLDVLRSHPSKQRAAAALGVDTKTITRCLTKFGLQRRRWGVPDR